jgi:hypothetical protein
MDESNFWAHLEFRVCHEIEGLKQPNWATIRGAPNRSDLTKYWS